MLFTVCFPEGLWSSSVSLSSSSELSVSLSSWDFFALGFPPIEETLGCSQKHAVGLSHTLELKKKRRSWKKFMQVRICTGTLIFFFWGSSSDSSELSSSLSSLLRTFFTCGQNKEVGQITISLQELGTSTSLPFVYQRAWYHLQCHYPHHLNYHYHFRLEQS